ncbi:MAG: diguanylate cyclase domain-containing protein [Microthrixaceae bacterium]
MVDPVSDAVPDGAGGRTYTALAQVAGRECPDVLALLDSEFTARWVSPSITAAFGHDPESLLGTGVSEMVHMEDLTPVLNGIDDAGRADGRHAAIECRLQTASGDFLPARVTSRSFTRDGEMWWVLSIRPVADDDSLVGKRSRLQFLASEAALTCSEMRSDERANLVTTLENLAAIIGASGIAVWKVTDVEGELCTSWTAYPRGTPPRPVVPIESLQASGHQTHTDDAAKGSLDVEAVEIALPSGRHRTGVLVAEFRGPGGSGQWDGHNIDLVAVIGGLVFAASERADAENLLLQRAETDQLTGLLNSGAVKERIAGMLEDPDDASVCLVFGDLDGFKQLNDTLGHNTGDAVLVAVAEAMREATGRDAVIGRVGGDEFVVAHALSDISEGMKMMNRCRAALREHLSVFGDVDMSLGMAMSDPDDTALDLLNRADVDMYTEKRRRSVWRSDDGVPSWDTSDSPPGIERRVAQRRALDRRSDLDRRAADERRARGERRNDPRRE